MSLSNWIELTTAAILLVTLIKVISYTKQTRRLADAAFEQLSASVRPCVAITSEALYNLDGSRIKPDSLSLNVKNTGVCPAFNVAFEEWSANGLVIEFDDIPLLSVNESRPSQGHMQSADEGSKPLENFNLAYFLSALQEKKGLTKFKTSILYSDIAGVQYVSRYEIIPRPESTDLDFFFIEGGPVET